MRFRALSCTLRGAGLNPPPCLPAGRHQGGGKSFRELDAPQLCCGVLHYGKRSFGMGKVLLIY